MKTTPSKESKAIETLSRGLPSEGEELCAAMNISEGDRQCIRITSQGGVWLLELEQFGSGGDRYFQGSESYSSPAELYGALSALDALNDDGSIRHA